MGEQFSKFASSQEKIALFRSYFRGREDLYPRKFISKKTGKPGYTPECANKWIEGVCRLGKKQKCFECPHRKFLPVTDQVVYWHLCGKNTRGEDFVLGIYPMLLDETCFFVAVDFDKKSWEEDAVAYLQTCKQMGVSAVLERSQSGKGAHIWMFFEEAVSASIARKLASHLLTETMERRPDIGLDSYDRFFPNQDTLPKGGFGNLIVLPLQKKARAFGNGEFIDENLVAYKDQWKFLSEIEKIGLGRVEEITSKADSKGRVVGVALHIEEENNPKPWKLPPSRRKAKLPIGNLPKKLELVLGSQIFIEKEKMPPGLRNKLIRLAAFQNPEFYKAQALRFPTHEIPRIIACAEEFSEHIALPRGCLEELEQLLSDLKIKTTIKDERNKGTPLKTQFLGDLRPEQIPAAENLLQHDTGVLAATTAFGKTVIASWLISQRKSNTLILVHRKQLQEQWIERLAMFLDLPPKSIGRIGGGRRKPSGIIDVALIQSLFRKGVVDDIVGGYGHLIVDECHHIPAHSFEQVVRQTKAKYVTGLSATVVRKDGHHPIITMQCGPIRHRVCAKKQAAKRPFTHTVLVRPTAFRELHDAPKDTRQHLNKLLSELIVDTGRNQLICQEVILAAREGRSPIVLTERNAHLDLLHSLLSPSIQNLIVLRGGMRSKELAKVSQQLASIPDTEERVLLATGKYIGEGFDDPRLDTLFLTFPISWRGTIAQYVGRLHRNHHDKQEVRVYDYADLNVPLLERMFNRRCKGYEAVGYQIQLPASAKPGWPVEAPLPVQPEWKIDYAATVQRLLRDGVDEPLANLFVQAAIPQKIDEKNFARSSSEAFLFKRLETLPETTGRFQLNAELPIPFNDRGSMEVDFLCAKAKLVVELDGEQHFANHDAYRSDRRKDALLQENGYMVLRFLSKDVSTHLSEVLDTILRALTRRERK